jgi:hypothetical protein
VVDELKLCPGDPADAVGAEFNDLRAGQRGQQRRVGGTDDLPG